MPVKKGTRPPNAGKGRPKGAKNRVTRDVRAAIAELLQANVHKVPTWLDAVAKKNPARALELLIRLLEYHIPKLARSEMQLGVEERPKDVYELTDEELIEIALQGSPKLRERARRRAAKSGRKTSGASGDVNYSTFP